MQSAEEDSSRATMDSLRVISEREIPMNQQKLDSFAVSFRESLDLVKMKAQRTVENQAKLAKLKAVLRDAEDDYVKVIAAKTRKEAKQMAIRDSLSATKRRVEELRKVVEVQRAKKDECAAILSQQTHALEGKTNRDNERNGEVQQAILWYNRVLGLHIEGGHGVKFTFRNINMKNPNEEFSFTIRHANDTYTLLECDPPLNNIKELIQDLNRTNGLFKFVRIMHEKFQEAAVPGSQSPTRLQDISTISMSGPVFSVSTDTSDSHARKNEYSNPDGSESVAKTIERQFQHEVNRQSNKVNHKGAESAIISPGSTSSRRQSPHFKRVHN